MGKLIIILFALVINFIGFAQEGIYIGYENGGKFDKFHYVNSEGFALSMLPLDGVLGAYIGYNLQGYTLETGFYGFYTSHPFVSYDYATAKPSRSSSSGGSSDMNNWVIPLRFGKEFLFFANRFFLKPEIAFTAILARDYSDDQPTGGWGENVSPFPGFPYFSPTSSDSTRAYSYRTSRVNMGIETAFSFGYRFKEKADIYLKGSYHSSFNPLYYETIIHYSDDEIVKATSTHTGNSFLIQIGLRYFLAKRDK